MLSWQKQRSSINHDWLKNQYIPALAKFINLLEGRVEDKIFEDKFTSSILPEWTIKYSELIVLPIDFEKDMSPKTIIKRVFLIFNSDDLKTQYEWVEELIHRLWKYRYNVQKLIDNTAHEISLTNKLYQDIQYLINSSGKILPIDVLRLNKILVYSFKQRCINLSKTIERFPSEVKVI